MVEGAGASSDCGTYTITCCISQTSFFHAGGRYIRDILPIENSHNARISPNGEGGFSVRPTRVIEYNVLRAVNRFFFGNHITFKIALESV